MFGGLGQIRRGEGRDTFVAAGSLFVLLAAHALLETARDALFLASIDASRLPVVYIGVAVAALAVASLQERGPSGRAALSAWLGISGLVTGGFHFLVGSGQWVLYALYIWSAVVVTGGLTRFFILLGGRFSQSQAKRLYSVIGAGSVLGAIAGSGLAGLLLTVITPHELLMVGAGALLLAALGPLALSASEQKAFEPTPEKTSPLQSLTTTLQHPYARRVAVLMVLATVTFTFVDFAFKSEVASNIPADELGFFFARVYFALNVVSLFVQLFLVNWLIRVGGPTRALALLPGLLVFGGLGMLFGGGVFAGVALKGADGGLRHSLHRTASELLYVPMSSELRKASKTLIDIAGHRGGQAIASVIILCIAALGVDPVYIGAVILVLAGVAFALTVELRHHYLDVFRGTLAEAAEHKHVAFPELSLATLESLIATLSSTDEKRVEVALELFAEQGRAHLIPSLILYHPDPNVLAKALGLLASTGRTDFIPLADRLLDHEYAHVRAAALRARMELAPEEALLRSKVEVRCPVVRATALVGLTAGGFSTIEETGDYLDMVVTDGSDVAKEALARAIGYGPARGHDEYLVRLAVSDNDDVLLSVARSMGKSPTPKFVPHLVNMLARRTVRSEARKALVGLGDDALDVLESTLMDGDADVGVRRQIPHTIVLFDPARAAKILSRGLLEVQSGAVRYRILRALNRLVSEHPKVSLDRQQFSAALEREVSGAYRLLDWRLTLERGAEEQPARRSRTHQLLVRMLHGKEENARERMFRLLGVLHPEQGLQTLYRGLKSERADVGASVLELLESFVAPRVRRAVLGLVDDLPDQERLRLSDAPAKLGYVDVLRVLLDAESDSLRSLAVYHVGELGLVDLKQTLEALKPEPNTSLATVIQQTIALLTMDPEPAS